MDPEAFVREVVKRYIYGQARLTPASSGNPYKRGQRIYEGYALRRVPHRLTHFDEAEGIQVAAFMGPPSLIAVMSRV